MSKMNDQIKKDQQLKVVADELNHRLSLKIDRDAFLSRVKEQVEKNREIKSSKNDR